MASQHATQRHVIVGNGIAGTTAAEQIRKADSAAQITLITNEPYSLYNRIALPPLLRRKVNQQKVMIKNVAWHEERDIDLRLETLVTRVSTADRELELGSGEVLPYDRLLIATGGRPNPLPQANGLANVYNFQTLDEALAIDDQITRSERAITVGGSYIAYELTEAFRARGLETTWLMRGSHFLRRALDSEGGALVDAIAEKNGVRVVHGAEVAEVRGVNGAVREVLTSSGEVLPCNLLAVGVGITRNVDFLVGSGIDVRKGVVADECLRASAPDVYAAGDVAEYYDRYIGKHTLMGTWDNATTQGKVVARNMLDIPTPYDEVPTYATTLFDSRITAFGDTPETSSDLEAAMRIHGEAETYRRLFFRGSHLVGGVIIGQRKGLPRLLELVRHRTPIPKGERTSLLALE